MKKDNEALKTRCTELYKKGHKTKKQVKSKQHASVLASAA